MGSFNASCAISNITLGPGAPAKLIFIAENNPTRRRVLIYPTDLYYPVSFAMDVTYDDCGKFNIDEKSMGWKGFSDYMAKELHCENVDKEIKDKINTDTNQPYTFADRIRLELDIPTETIQLITPEYIFNKIHNGELKLSNGAYVGIYPVHKEVWEKWCVANFTSWQGKVITKGLLIEESKSEILTEAAASTKCYMQSGALNEDIVRKSQIAFHLFKCAKYNYQIMDYDYPWEKSIQEYGFDAVLEAKVELFMMLNKLSDINKAIHLQPTAGQDSNQKPVYEFHTLCAGIAKEVHNKEMQDYSDDDEELIK